jgi:hypothetical protein
VIFSQCLDWLSILIPGFYLQGLLELIYTAASTIFPVNLMKNLVPIKTLTAAHSVERKRTVFVCSL